MESSFSDRYGERRLADGDVHVCVEAFLRRILPAAAVRSLSSRKYGSPGGGAVFLTGLARGGLGGCGGWTRRPAADRYD